MKRTSLKPTQKKVRKNKATRELFAGIDPGKSGAVGILDVDGRFVEVIDCPESDDACADIFYIKHSRIRMCTLEKVSAMPGQGVSSTMKFGKNKGVWRGVLAAFGIPRQYVTSVEWQKIKGPRPKHTSRKEKKEQSIRVARELWPEVPITLKKHADRAEALLIAEYGRRKFLGQL